MRYNKDKTAIIYNDFLTMDGIPPEAHEYRLGNRSALDWIVDQYKVSIDKRSGITNDPNRDDDPQYVVRLIKKIVTISLRTNEIIESLPACRSRNALFLHRLREIEQKPFILVSGEGFGQTGETRKPLICNIYVKWHISCRFSARSRLRAFEAARKGGR